MPKSAGPQILKLHESGIDLQLVFAKRRFSEDVARCCKDRVKSGDFASGGFLRMAACQNCVSFHGCVPERRKTNGLVGAALERCEWKSGY